MAVETRTEAPDFALYTNKRERFQLSDYRDKQNVLLLFFPGAFTSVCISELSAVNGELEAYGGDATQIVGVSTDSPFVLEEFRTVHKFQFPLLSDHDAVVSDLYGAKYHYDFTPMKLDRISKRAAFLIDKAGAVQYAEVLDNAGDLPDFDAIKQVIASLN